MRDPSILKKSRQDKPGGPVIFTGDTCIVKIQEKLEALGCVTIADTVKTLGVFDMEVDGVTSGMILVAHIEMKPSDIETIEENGSKIIKLRGRSSFQSPAYQAVKMIEASMGGAEFNWPAGCYVNCDKCGFKNVMMAMPSTINADGVHFTAPEGTAEEMEALQASYQHLIKMREEIIALGIIPAVEEWTKVNPNL